jgi:hypothetical protein
MKTCKHIPHQYIEIWAPRYKDRVVLLAAHKIGDRNKVVFTKAKHMGTDPYFISGAEVKKYKKETNGRIECYAVPLDKFEPLEYEDFCEHLI